MTANFASQFAALIVGVISAAGYVGVAGLMALESACLPLPSEIIMPFAGYLASTGRFDLTLVATAGAIGCNAGSSVAYAIGATGGRRFVERWGRYVLLATEDLDRADSFFARHGNWAVLIGRLLPVVRTFIALPAGVSRMPQVPFQAFTFIGSWPWCYGLAYVGFVLGTRWDSDPTAKRTARVGRHRRRGRGDHHLMVGLAPPPSPRWRMTPLSRPQFTARHRREVTTDDSRGMASSRWRSTRDARDRRVPEITASREAAASGSRRNRRPHRLASPRREGAASWKGSAC